MRYLLYICIENAITILPKFMGNGTVYKRITVVPTKNNRYFNYTDPIYASIVNVQYLMSRK